MGLCTICGYPESNDECCRNQPCRECDKLKAHIERLTKVLAYVEGALASSEEPWLREAHQVIIWVLGNFEQYFPSTEEGLQEIWEQVTAIMNGWAD